MAKKKSEWNPFAAFDAQDKAAGARKKKRDTATSASDEFKRAGMIRSDPFAIFDAHEKSRKKGGK
jgi:hypothetical protein